MRWRITGGVIIVVGVIGWAVFEILAVPAVTQPIEFPHKVHVELGLQCTNCHERAEKGTVAGRPPTVLCLSCHSGGDGTGEIKKVQAFEKGGEIPWRRVWRLPSHVFFPHRTHVVVAKVQCQTCHGPMETLDRPPARPLKTLTMGDCISCHVNSERQNQKGTGAVQVAAPSLSTDCNACHR